MRNKGEAVAIFKQIDISDRSLDEKGEAIYEVLDMPTHNGITKDEMLKVIRFLFNLCFDLRENADEKEQEAVAGI